MAILVRKVIPEKSSHCRPLQPTLTWQFQSGVGGNSWKRLSLQPIAAHSYIAISVRGGNSWKVLPLQPIAAHSYMEISVRGVIPQKSSHCSRLQPTLTWQFHSGVGGNSWKRLSLQPIAAHSYIAISVRGGNSWKVLPLQPIAAHSFMAILVRGVIPEKSSHCSPYQPTLIWQFQSGGNSWKDLPLQPIVGNSWKVLPLQPIAAHSYMAISVRGQFLKSPPFAINCSPLLHGNFSQGVISENSSHCRALQPTPTWQFQSGGNSWKVLPLQPIAAHSYMAISVRGVIHEKSSHCSPLQPTLTLQFQSRGVIPEKSSHCSRLQPTFTWQFQSEGLCLKRPLITAHCSPLLHGNFSQGGG